MSLLSHTHILAQPLSANMLLWCMCLQFQNAVQCFVFANNANTNTSQLNYIRCVQLEAVLHIKVQRERFESMHSRLLSIAVGTQQAAPIGPVCINCNSFFHNMILLHNISQVFEITSFCELMCGLHHRMRQR